MNWLEILGSLGSGVSQGIPQGMQEAAQYQQSQGASALGDALAGVQSSSGQPTGVFSGLTSAINNMMGGQSPQIQIPQAPQAQFQQAPAIPSSMISQAAPQPVSIPAMSPASPMTAQAAPSAIGPQAAPQTTLSQTPQGGQGQPFSPVGTYHPPIPPQQGQQAPQPQQAQGFLTLPDLIDRLKQARPGIRGQQMTNAVAAAIPLLNQQGLQQYHDIGAQLRRQAMGIAEERVGVEAARVRQQGETAAKKEQFQRDREKRLARQSAANRQSRENTARMNKEIEALRTQYNTAVKDLNSRKGLATDQREKWLVEINKKYNENRADIMKRYQTAPQAQEPEAAGEGAGAGGAGTAEDPVIVTNPGDETRLPPGTVFKTPDGQLLVR